MRLRLALPMLLLLAGASPEALAQAPAGDYEALVSRARSAAAAGDARGAAATLAEALQAFPEDFALHLEQAGYLLRSRDWAGAERAYRSALALSEVDLEARVGLADALAGAARWSEVAALTAALLERGREDASLHNRHALALFWLWSLDASEATYRRALAARPGDLDARLGLAWIAQRRGEVHAARSGFEQVERLRPGDPSAREGLAALGSPTRIVPSLHAGALLREAGGAEYLLVAGLDARFLDRWRAGARYRRLATLQSAGKGRGGGTTSASFSQDEGYLTAGFDASRWGVGLQLGYLGFRPGTRRSEALAHSGAVAAIRGRAEAWASLSAAAALSLYDDLDVWQLELGAALPVAAHLSLFLGGRLMVAASEPHGAILGEARLHGASWLVAAGGAYGTQVRPVELDAVAAYNQTAPLPWVLRARGRLGLGERVELLASYDYERSEERSGPSGAHRAMLGAAVSF